MIYEGMAHAIPFGLLKTRLSRPVHYSGGGSDGSVGEWRIWWIMAGLLAVNFTIPAVGWLTEATAVILPETGDLEL
jgi:hypothetical protein